MDESAKNGRRWVAGAGLVAAGVLGGAILAGTLSAEAATPSGSGPTSSSAAPSGSTSAGNGRSGGPGVQENDGIPEAQEHHGRGLELTGTVTAVGSGTVTIKTSTGAVTSYQVDSSSDIDKNGEAQLNNLAIGDAVTYSVRSGTTTIDKLHAGDESRNIPSGRPGSGGGTAGAGYAGDGVVGNV